MITKKSLLITSLIALAISFNAVASKPIYKWKDDQGNIKYTQSKPPRGVEFETIYQRQSNTQNQNQPEQTEKSSSVDKDPIAQSQDEIIAKQEQAKKANEEIRRKNCVIAKNNLDSLNNSSRIFVEDGGNRRMLSDEDRKNRMEQAKSNIEQYCN